MSTKKGLREEIRQKLKAQSLEERSQKSLRIQDRLFSLAEFQKAAWVCFYVALPEEVDTVPMIEKAIGMGKRVAIPLSDLENKELKTYEIKDLRNDVRKGAFRILEPDPKKTVPVEPSKLEVVVVPGLVFDRENYRIGRGQGFYDRFLAGAGRLPLQERVFKIGLAFSFQVVPSVPHESHDQKLDLVLTDL